MSEEGNKKGKENKGSGDYDKIATTGIPPKCRDNNDNCTTNLPPHESIPDHSSR